MQCEIIPCGEKQEHTQSSFCALMTRIHCREDLAAFLSGGQGNVTTIDGQGAGKVPGLLLIAELH